MRHFDPDYIVQKSLSQRGPFSGNGRGPGRRWGGLVEETPVLWIAWVTSAAKKAGVNPQNLFIAFYQTPLTIVTTRLTFGLRYYWLCPTCYRRCEAIFYNGRVGCQRCLNLGYLSEAHRQSSAWAILDRIFSRDFPYSRYGPPDEAATIVAGLRAEFEAQLKRIIEGVKVSNNE
jgi:hypothetical protein